MMPQVEDRRFPSPRSCLTTSSTPCGRRAVSFSESCWCTVPLRARGVSRLRGDRHAVVAERVFRRDLFLHHVPPPQFGGPRARGAPPPRAAQPLPAHPPPPHPDRALRPPHARRRGPR